jgi:hypothetical protein
MEVVAILLVVIVAILFYEYRVDGRTSLSSLKRATESSAESTPLSPALQHADRQSHSLFRANHVRPPQKAIWMYR